MRNYWGILICVFIANVGLAQQKNLELAEAAFQNHDYYEASEQYIKALKKSADEEIKRDIAYRVARCFHLMHNFNEAILWYQDAVGEQTDKYSLLTDYGDALLHLAEYDKALALYQQAYDISNDFKIKEKIESCKKSKQASTIAYGNTIREVRQINSSYSEYGLGWFESKIVFSTTKPYGSQNRLDGRTSQPYSDIYQAQLDGTEVIGQVAKLPAIFNSYYNDGSFAYDERTRTAFFMRCKETRNSCELLASVYNKSKSKWGKALSLPFNSEDFSTGHPSISGNGNTLYFVSDNPDGIGGRDIYKVNRKSDGDWGLPVNIGNVINTAKDEMFPTIISDTLLFFASDGHSGYGGLDLFVCHIKDFEISPPVNLGAPFNSSSDDFNLILKDDFEYGYFCSNRNKESGDDIYYFEGFPLLLELSGTVRDYNTKAGINKVLITNNKDKINAHSDDNGKYSYPFIRAFQTYSVTASKPDYMDEVKEVNIENLKQIFHSGYQLKVDFLMHRTSVNLSVSGKVTDRESGNAIEGQEIILKDKDQIIKRTQTNVNGIFSFTNLKSEIFYTIKLERKGFFSESRSFQLRDAAIDKNFSKENGTDLDFLLTKIETKKEIVIRNIYYDFDKASLRPESKTELDKLASMLRETPDVVVQINSHTDSRGSHSYNDKLSISRAQSVVNYLVESGISRNRLVAKGFGKQSLLYPKAKTEFEHQKNRRTSFSVVSSESKAEASPLQFRLQLLSTSTKKNISTYFAAIRNHGINDRISETNLNGIWRYEIGEKSNLEEIKLLKSQLKAIGYSDCFITAYYDNKKISLSEAKQYIQ